MAQQAIELTILDDLQFRRFVAGLPRIATESILLEAEGLRRRMEAAVRTEAPRGIRKVPVRTGKGWGVGQKPPPYLKESITSEVDSRGTSFARSSLAGQEALRIRISTGVPYARFVLQGRGPITAVRSRRLLFVAGRGPFRGQIVGPTSVGPAAANPFVDRALERASGTIDATLTRIGRHIEARWTSRGAGAISDVRFR